MSAIHTDAPNANTTFSTDEAADELMKLWQSDDAQDEPSDEPEDEENEDQSEEEPETEEDSAEEPEESKEDEESDEDQEEDTDEEDEPKKRKVLKDDAVVKVKVGDSEEEVPVSKLTRLYGQEKALTQKSMEVAERRKEFEGLGEKHVAAAEQLHVRAMKRFEPYAKIDWALAVKELDTEEYKALRDEATRAYEDVKFYEQEVDGYLSEVKKARDTERLNTAKATLKNLSDPKSGIPGFSQQMYVDMMSYAESNGMSREAFGNIVEEAPLRMIYKAMMLDKGKTAVTKKIDKKNKKILKSKASPEVSRQTFTKSKDKDAMSRLKKSGSADDAVEALMARWSSDD